MAKMSNGVIFRMPPSCAREQAPAAWVGARMVPAEAGAPAASSPFLGVAWTRRGAERLCEIRDEGPKSFFHRNGRFCGARRRCTHRFYPKIWKNEGTVSIDDGFISPVNWTPCKSSQAGARPSQGRPPASTRLACA